MLERRDLICTLNELKNHRIIVVCAPAGYGKTVAVTQWLKQDTRAKAIFSVDEYDNNLSGFCERFCDVLYTCQPQNKTLNEIISHPSFQNAPEVFALRAIASLSGKKSTVLAIDDIHLIHNSAVLQLLLVFIKRLPINFNIIIISRHDLPFGLSELWIKGQAARISAEQLRFTHEDIIKLHEKRGSRITQAQAEYISRQTQGWAIGINAFLLSGDSSSADFSQVYSYLDEFIQSNIWAKWDGPTRDFMLRTSYLRELTPSLCEILTGLTYSDAFLKELVQRGAFITQMQNDIYRYHHLFQQFLKRKADECGESFVYSLLETEGNWYLSQMNFYNAVNCFIKCKNHYGIAKCFDLLKIFHHNTLILDKLFPILKHPEMLNVTKKYPYLLYLLIWCAYAEGRKDDMTFYMDEYYTRHPEIAAEYPAVAYEVHTIRLLDFRISKSRALEEIEVSNSLLYTPIHYWTPSLHMPLLYRGIIDFSEAAVGDVVEYIQEKLIPNFSLMYGDLTLLLAESIMAGLLYEQGRLEEAYEHSLKANVALNSNNLPDTKFSTMSMLAYILDASGDEDEAASVIDSISQMIEENRAYHLNHNYNAFTARRKFIKGETGAAQNWLDTNSLENKTLYGLYSDVTTCRAYIATGKYGSAIILLKKILEIAFAFNRPLDITEAQILLAIAYWKKKGRFQNEALEHLENAIWTAYPYSYVQMFVNEGAVLAGMLHKLFNRAKQQKEDRDKPLSFIKMLHLKTRSSTDIGAIDELSEKDIKFTDKQKTIMGLLCQGKSYREVAEALGIKRSTVCSHLELIYSKLDVTNMVDLIAKIDATDLLNK